MKTILRSIFMFGLLMFGLTVSSFAQEKETGDSQVGAFGGLSLPMGTYKSIGETKSGYFGGLYFDQYFRGNRFGLGLDGRFLQHGIHLVDSFHFQNGHIGTNYVGATRFRHVAATLGPTYKFETGGFQLEAFLRGGMLMQFFPQYETTLSYADASGTMIDVPIKRTANDSTNRANAWVGLGGLRMNYKLSSSWAVFAQVDYMQSFGAKFAGKPAQYQVEVLPSTGVPIDEQRGIKSFSDHYGDVFASSRTPYQSLNASVGVKYIFGNRKSPERIVEAPVVAEKSLPKSIQIVVKDKQTGLALSGVRVSIVSAAVSGTSLTDAEGQAERLEDATAAEYTIVGEKNGIKTESLVLKASDFMTNETIIYREILHDDPRFTLIGETVDCDMNQNLSNISTVLTRADTKNNMYQTSDVSGKFIYQLEQNSDYSIVANQAGRYSQTELVSTKGLDRSKTLYVTLKLGVCNLIEGDNWVLKNIHYDFDKFNIRPDAAVILDNVVAIMKQNPSLVIELSSHTDSRGDDQYNQRLSQQRAESAVAYLVRNGIDRSRLVAAGYGESRLLNTCGNGVNCSEEQHQENRRTEIKVLSFN